MMTWPNHALQRTRHGVAVGNPRVPCAGSLSLGRSAMTHVMHIRRFTVALTFLLAFTGCGDRAATSTPQSLTTTNAEQEKFWRMVDEARQLEADADVVLTVEGTRATNSVRVLRPALPSFTNELSTASDFKTLATSLQRRDSAVIRMWGVGWDTNLLAQVAGHLHAAGFHSVRAVALRFGQVLPGTTL